MNPNYDDAKKLVEAIGMMTLGQIPPHQPFPKLLLDLVVAHLTLAYTRGEIAGRKAALDLALKAIDDTFGPGTTQGS